MNRLPRILKFTRPMSSIKPPSFIEQVRQTSALIGQAVNIDEQISKANQLKDSAIDQSLDQYINFVNRTSAKVKNIQIPSGKKITITTSLNLGMMGITTVIEDKI